MWLEDHWGELGGTSTLAWKVRGLAPLLAGRQRAQVTSFLCTEQQLGELMVAQAWGHTTGMGDLQKCLFVPSHLGTPNGWFTFQAKSVRESTRSQKR